MTPMQECHVAPCVEETNTGGTSGNMTTYAVSQSYAPCSQQFFRPYHETKLDRAVPSPNALSGRPQEGMLPPVAQLAQHIS